MKGEEFALTVGGKIYEGWTSVRVTRAVNQGCSDFELEVTERWAGQGRPWQIKRFDPCTISSGGGLLLTGYIDDYMPSYDGNSHTVRVAGRSKTCDLVDCMPDVGSGEFAGYRIDQVARNLAGQFGIGVVTQGSMGAALPTTAPEFTETGYALIEKLCRLQGLLAFDDAAGNLVLATVGTRRTAGALIEGVNIKKAAARLSAKDRFSNYVVLSQMPLSWDGQQSHEQVIGQATDNAVPRFRRHAELAEGPGTDAMAQKRAVWRAKRNMGASTQATITVKGWRQPDGSFWPVNQLVPVKSPMLELGQDMAIARVSFSFTHEGGHETELVVMPPEAFIPEPDEVSLTTVQWHSDVKAGQ